MIVEQGAVIKQTAAEIAGTLAPYFKLCSELWFHDKYFRLLTLSTAKPSEPAWQRYPPRSAKKFGAKSIVAKTRAPHQREFPKDIVGKLIPEGITIEWFHWAEKQGGVPFHDRYLLTEAGGVSLGDGFSAEGPSKTVNVQLIAKRIYEITRERIVPEASVYELKDKFRILSDGSIEEF